MGDIITNILKRATEAGLNMYLEDGKIKVSSVRGKIDPSLRDEIFEQVSLNKKEIINKLRTLPRSETVRTLQELGAVPSASTDAPSQGCGKCGGTIWRSHSQETGTWLCTPCNQEVAEVLMERMKNGTSKLMKLQLIMDNEEETDKYVRMTEKFSEWLALWSDLEYDLRFALDYHGCIYTEGGCPKDSPVRCGACG